MPVLGSDPAANVAEVARRNGVPSLCEFFGAGVGLRLRSEGRLADVLHANNVLAHVADLNGFVAGIAAVLRPDGLAVVEVPHVQDLVERLEFDTIYHEHLCYFSLSALAALFSRHGLTVVDVERLAIHGGSIRVFAAARGEPAARVARLLERERAAGVHRLGFYRDFGDRVRVLSGELRSLLGRLKGDGGRLAAYGASAKGTTLLNYCGVGGETLEYVVDRSTAKQGLYTPGSRLPILPPGHLVEDRPDCVLLLTWNFADEILAQQADYRAAGGRFVVPVPRPSIV